MIAPVFLILVFVVMTIFAVVMLGGWLIYSIFRLLGRGVESIFYPRRKTPVGASSQSVGWTCPRSMCRSVNPNHAKFCRRCGRPVAVERVRARVALASI